MNKILDPIRQKLVTATPEEIVRQQWISVMIDHLGFPRGLLAVEKDLRLLCDKNLSTQFTRRVDLVCFTPGDTFTPLLIVEFKAQDQLAAPEKQVSGYNFYLNAPFWAIIQGDVVQTFWKEKEQVQTVHFLPSFSQLLQKLGIKWEKS